MQAYSLNYRLFAYNTTEYIKDMGTPGRFQEVQRDVVNGLPSILSYKTAQKALFVDRDNTLISVDKGDYLLSRSNLRFLDDNIAKVANISKNFNLVCLVTNSPQIAMGKLTFRSLDELHSMLVQHCITLGLKIDVIALCPHHPHNGFDYEIPSLKTTCFCRKPSPGMLVEQSFLRNIDLQSSLFIGDTDVDRLAASSVGCPYLDVSCL